MTRHYFLILTILVFKIHAQRSVKCNCQAIVDPETSDSIVVYDKPGGNSIKTLSNNEKDQDYLVLSISVDSAVFFKVKIAYALSKNNAITGWIKKTKSVGTYARNYSSSLTLYSSPDVHSKTQATLPEWTKDLYTITKCKGEWVYVKLDYKGQIKEGWLQPDKQCANSYTTCD